MNLTLSSTGEVTTTANARLTSQYYLLVKKGTIIIVSNGFQIKYNTYETVDINSGINSFTGNTNHGFSEDKKIIISDDCYVRISIRKSDQSDIVLSEITDAIKIYPSSLYVSGSKISNILKYVKDTKGIFLSSTGVETLNKKMKVTDYIPVNHNNLYVLKLLTQIPSDTTTQYTRVVSYDEDKNFIEVIFRRGIGTTTDADSDYNIPINIGPTVSFIRISYAYLAVREIDLSCYTSIDSISRLSSYKNQEDIKVIEQEKFSLKKNDQYMVQDMVDIAYSYLNRTNDSGFIMHYGVNTPLSTTYNDDKSIDCSTFIGFVLRGISFDESPYVKNYSSSQLNPFNPSQFKASQDHAWAINPAEYEYDLFQDVYYPEYAEARRASQLAEMFVKQGREVPLDKYYANMQAGDILFFSKKDSLGEYIRPTRYRYISHVALLTKKEEASSGDSWDTSIYPYKHTCIDVSRGGSSDPVYEWILEEREISETSTGYGTLSLVVRPDLGSVQDGTLEKLKNNSLTNRGNLTSSMDMDTVTEPGYYFKDLGVTVPNGVNSNHARVLVIRNHNSEYSITQIWFDCSISTTGCFFRTRRSGSYSYSAWRRLTDETQAIYCHISGQTEPGGIGIVSGQVSGYLNNPDTVRYSRSERQYTCVPGAIIVPEFLSDTSATQLALYFYDSNNDYLSSTTHDNLTTPFTVPSSANYFKLVTFDPNGTNIRCEKFTLHSNLPISETYNPNIINSSDGRTLAFTYQTGDSITSGRLMLPPNYDIGGKNVPLIVFAHGSGGMVSWDSKLGQYGLNDPPDGDYYDYLKYLTDEGFAVFDCYPWTKQVYVPIQTYSPYLMPLHITSYLDGIKYVCSRFNVDIDRVSVLCKSQGGHFGQWAYMQNIFNFKAVCLFAPATGIINTSFYMRNARKAITLYTDFDCTEEELDAWIETNSGRSTNALVQSFNAKNKAILLSFCPMTQGITNSDLTTLYNGSVSAIDTVPQWLVDILGPMPAGASNNYSLSTHNEFVKNSTVPCKFWAALDDEEAPAYTTYAVYTWLTNGGSDASFRILPTGTGGHHATDNSPLALTQSGTTTLGISYTDMPLAYVEAVEFIRKKCGG